MNPLTESEVDDLLGAYALDALAPADRQRVEEHLAGCDRHADAAAELVRAASALALSVDDREPPPGLRSRVLAAIGAPAPPAAARRTGWWRPGIAALAAAALLILGGGIAIGRLTAPQPQEAQVTTWTFHGNAQSPGVVAHLVFLKADHRGVIAVTGLKPLGPGQVYELWLFKGSTPVDAGIGQAQGGVLTAQLSDLTPYSQIAMTVEPGEQPKPTNAPILVGKLGST